MRLRGITRNVVVLGWVSFLTDLATEMLYPVMPLFLVSLPGGSALLLGWVDGLAEGVSSGLRWVGGALSDRYGRRKPFVYSGYGISAISKPIMGLAAVVVGWPLFLIGRIADRLGKSIRTSARDALIADSTEEAYRGTAFGFHRAMDTTGAIIGPLLTLGIVIAIVGYTTTFSVGWGNAHGAMLEKLPLKWLFFVALIPGLLSAMLAMSAIREIPPAHPGGGRPAFLQSYPWPFWHLILANALFSLGNSSDAFLVLRASQGGLAFGHVVLAYAIYNTVYALGSAPLGRLSDHIGRKPVIICGWLVYAAVYAGFALYRWPWTAMFLFGVYGLYQAFAEGVTKAMVSDLVPSRQRAGAIGLFYTVAGFGQLIASIVTGALISANQVKWAFLIGSCFAAAAIPVIATVSVRRRAHPATA